MQKFSFHIGSPSNSTITQSFVVKLKLPMYALLLALTLEDQLYPLLDIKQLPCPRFSYVNLYPHLTIFSRMHTPIPIQPVSLTTLSIHATFFRLLLSTLVNICFTWHQCILHQCESLQTVACLPLRYFVSDHNCLCSVLL